jgi:hypothetical protein
VRDAKGLLEVAKEGIARHGADSDVGRSISSAADLLCALLIQDIKETSDGKAEIVKGVAKDRIVSVTDPEMRHGRKSAHQRFDGHKATVVADAQTGLITDVDILPGNAHDSQNVMEVVERSEEAMGQKVEEVIGDSAYGSGGVRQQLTERGRHVVARVPPLPPTGKFTKRDFKIDEKQDRVTCPAGHVCDDFSVVSSNSGSGRDKRKRKRFTFDAKTCLACPLRHKCVTGSAPRSITVHPQEDLLQSARDFQRTPEFRKEYSLRIVVEHRIARLIQLGIRKARYFGRRKTLFQVLMAAAVANLTLIANAIDPMRALVSIFVVVTFVVSLRFARPDRQKWTNGLLAA